MKNLRAPALGALLFLSAIAGASALYHSDWRPRPPIPLASATVMVIPASGHGSGVHIGNGFVLTAAHVVEAEKAVNTKDTKGTERSAKVLWVSKEFDVALLQLTDSTAGLQSRRLSCAPLVGGQRVRLEGNPYDFGAAQSWGHVSVPKPQPAQDWASISIVDATLAPGMSGGPVVSLDRSTLEMVVGINVAAGPYPLNFIVPGETICPLLGRK